ncbi:T9SS type A sorting domain-containing protein [candidate division WOR-3 bacterium]|nr:T9SS type A sorting domain-containing protein [candidate division WOR-3 bacterium]
MEKKLYIVLFLVLLYSASLVASSSVTPGVKCFQLRRHTVNRIEMPITNWGEFGQNEVYTAGTYWPRITGEPYIYGAGIWIGAFVEKEYTDPADSAAHTYLFPGGNLPDTLIGDVLVSSGFNTVGSGYDFIPGPPDSVHIWDHYYDHQSHPEDRIYFSTDSVDMSEWPFTNQYGEPISVVFGRPDIWSDEETWCEYNDLCDSIHHEYTPFPTYSLGLAVRQITYGWNMPQLQDMLFILYEFENVSDDTIRHMFVGHASDMDVGDPDNDLLGLNITRQLGWTMTPGQEIGWTSPPPYYVGICILKGPRSDDTLYIYGVDGTGNVLMDTTIYPEEYIPLISFTKCTRQVDADDELKRYMMLGGWNIVTGEYEPFGSIPDIAPQDKRMVMGCGPFELVPGEIDTLAIAVLFSNGNTGGLDYLKEQADIAGFFVNPHGIIIISPAEGDTIDGIVDVEWETESSTGNPLFIDLFLMNDTIIDTIVTYLPDVGSYSWNTINSPDGFYRIFATVTDSVKMGFNLSGEFVINNPGNGFPEVTVFYPNGGEIFSGLQHIFWMARDPDGDTLTIDLYYSNDEGVTFIPITQGLENTGSFEWDTENFPNGIRCLIKVEVGDGELSSSDVSDYYFAVQNEHESPWDAEHEQGECNTLIVTPLMIRPDEVIGHEYEVRFRGIQYDTLIFGSRYSYDIYDLTDETILFSNCFFSNGLDNTLYFDFSPLFHGMNVEFTSVVDTTDFSPDSILVEIGNYPEDALETYVFFEPTVTEVNNFGISPETKTWAFRGQGPIEMRWIKVGDTLTCEFWDIANDVNIPANTLTDDGWCFSGKIPIRPPKTYLTADNRAIWFYVSGVRYFFNNCSAMTVDQFNQIDSGDVWIIYNSGDRQPLPGDVYVFQTEQGISETTPYLAIRVFPNPFREETVISLECINRVDAAVTWSQHSIKIYDLTGRLIRTFNLCNPCKSEESVIWNGRDDSGKKVPSGIYFLKFDAGEYTATKKLLKVR